MNKRFGLFSALAIILLLGIYFNGRYLDEFPSHIHAWAQSDRYALSLGFVKNDLNFFRPQTFVMNHQFPGDWKVPSDESITAVDFPLHDYIPAVFMKITGIRSPWIFRLYILLYSFAGLFFLYRLSLLLGNDFLKSAFLILFAATSPVFAYYQGGFLPTIPSLSNAIIGIFFYIKYLQQDEKKHLHAGFVFLTLATLSRISFAIPLIAVTGTELARFIQSKGRSGSGILPVVLSYAAVAAYFTYNHYLGRKYGSIFLNHTMPPASFYNAKEILKATYHNWANEYFSKYHYLLFVIIALSAAFFFVKQRKRFEKPEGLIILLMALIFTGCILFLLLMMRQFPDHDYYFLDTFFLPVILLSAFLLSFIPPIRNKDSRITFTVILILISAFLIKKTDIAEAKRRATGEWDRNSAAIHNFGNADRYLDSLKIGRDARMLVMDSRSPNIPFILMDRKGYVVMSPGRENIKNALDWKYDYLVFQNNFFITETFAEYPEILTRIERIADNGRITVCRLSKKEKQLDLLTFFGLNHQFPVFKSVMDFDSLCDPHWSRIHPSEEHAHSGTCSGYLSPDDEFGLTYKTGDLNELRDKVRLLVCSAWFLHDTIRNCEIAATLNVNGTNIYYKSYNLDELLKKKGKWEQVQLYYQLPRVESGFYEFALYIWNNGRNRLYYDDFGFSLY